MIEVTSRKALENAGLYSIRGRRGFFFELLPELARKKRVRLSFLRVDDQPVAWQLELLSPGRSFLHHLAFDEKWKKYSPGKQLLKRCIELCWKKIGCLIFFLLSSPTRSVMQTSPNRFMNFTGSKNPYGAELPVV